MNDGLYHKDNTDTIFTLKDNADEVGIVVRPERLLS